MRRLLPLLLLTFASACEEEPPLPPPPRMDATWPDGGPPRDAFFIRRDAGPTGGILMDGVVDEEVWMDASTTEAVVDTDRPGSELLRLRAFIGAGRLFVAVEGSLAADDALTVYVDNAVGDAAGIDDLGLLTDETGALDSAISSALSTPSGYEMDYAFGTVLMPHAAVGLDDAAGWRELVVGDTLPWETGEDAPVVCSADACEASIDLDRLGGAAPRTLAIFARIVRGDGGWANQTLPLDDPASPGVVSTFLEIDEAVPEADAGTPDAGIDGGPRGVSIDGVLDPGEWTGAACWSNDVAPTAIFAGNRLTRLCALRNTSELYLSVEGSLTSGNAIVAYVDSDVGGPGGLISPIVLDDLVGDLDRAISKFLTPTAELQIDHAWGVLDMPRSVSSADARVGWRHIATAPSSFSTLTGLTACSASACETSITLSALGTSSTDEIGLALRLVSGTSLAMSNQTIPADDAFQPESIGVFARIAP